MVLPSAPGAPPAALPDVPVGVHAAPPPTPAAIDTDAARQFTRAFARADIPGLWLRPAARTRLAANQPVDPNAATTWIDADRHAQAILRRHGITGVTRHAARAAAPCRR